MTQLLSQNIEDGSMLQNIKLRFPILMGNKITIFGEIKYKEEEVSYPFIPLLEGQDDLSLTARGASLIYKAELGPETDFVGNIGFSQNSDTGLSNWRPRYGVTGILRHQVSDFTRVGFGVRLQNNRMIPILSYEVEFAKYWKFTALLPKEIVLARMASTGFRTYASLEAQGANYDLNTVSAQNEMTEYNRLGVDFRLGFEKSITDWIWFGAYGGYGVPLFSRVRDPYTRELFHENSQSITPVFGVSVFLVPPSKWLN